jgi:hypothetical protein
VDTLRARSGVRAWLLRRVGRARQHGACVSSWLSTRIVIGFCREHSTQTKWRFVRGVVRIKSDESEFGRNLILKRCTQGRNARQARPFPRVSMNRAAPYCSATTHSRLFTELGRSLNLCVFETSWRRTHPKKVREENRHVTKNFFKIRKHQDPT